MHGDHFGGGDQTGDVRYAGPPTGGGVIYDNLLERLRAAEAERDDLRKRLQQKQEQLDAVKERAVDDQSVREERIRELEYALQQVRTFCEPVNLAGPQEAARLAALVLKGVVR